MSHTRREFLVAAASGGVAATALGARLAAAAEKEAPKIRLSACDWSLRARGKLEAFDIAKRVGLDGVEVSAGNPADKLALADPKLRQQYKDKVKGTGIVISSTAMGLLNGCPLASDGRAPAWLEQTIEATADLGVTNILLAFFGKGDLRKGKTLKQRELDVVIGRLKDAAPKAKEAGVILGLENTLSAKDNAMILDRVGSDAVLIYYDVGNATHYGYDVPAEIRMLKGRICQFHFKDYGGWLGTKVKLEPIRDAINAIGYTGWIVLETKCPTGDRDADFRKNAATVRDLLGLKS